MKKTLLFVTLLVAGLVSCTKMEPELNANSGENAEDYVFTASIAQTKTIITIDGKKGKVAWKEGDEIKINGSVFIAEEAGPVSKFIKKEGEPNPKKNPTSPYYIATYGDVENQIYSEDGSNCPMEAQSDERELYFQNTCAVIKLTITDPSVVKNIFIEDTKLDCSANGGVDMTEGKAFYVAIPPASYPHLRISIIGSNQKVAKKTAKNAMTLERNTIQPISVSGLTYEQGYTSSEDGNMIVFAAGNLYKCSWGPWSFTTYPYEVAGDLNLQDGENVTRDLFGFGTSGWNSGKTSYQPWAKSNDEDTYFDESIHNTEADWGMDNLIQKNLKIGDSYAAGTWYTPRKFEWESIMLNRTTNYGHRYAMVKAGETATDKVVGGVLVFADDFEWPDGVTEPTIFDGIDPSKNWNDVIYYGEDLDKILAAGATFLPGGGLRTDGRTIKGTEVYWGQPDDEPEVCNIIQYITVFGGFYWASDGHWIMNFYDEQAPNLYEQPNCFGAAVRLVK